MLRTLGAAERFLHLCAFKQLFHLKCCVHLVQLKGFAFMGLQATFPFEMLPTLGTAERFLHLWAFKQLFHLKCCVHLVQLKGFCIYGSSSNFCIWNVAYTWYSWKVLHLWAFTQLFNLKCCVHLIQLKGLCIYGPSSNFSIWNVAYTWYSWTVFALMGLQATFPFEMLRTLGTAERFFPSASPDVSLQLWFCGTFVSTCRCATFKGLLPSMCPFMVFEDVQVIWSEAALVWFFIGVSPLMNL